MIHHTDDWLTVYGGDARDILPTLPDASVHCVVTSPPYWGLRDYGSEGQLGLEATPEEYVANLVAVFREVRRVLRDDGTVWLNLGDSYVSNGNYESSRSTYVGSARQNPDEQPDRLDHYAHRDPRPAARTSGLKPKDLVGIPWRVAFALQADGWWLRSDIIWSKPNPMPESVTDRPTKAHEYLFLLAKRERYYFDQEAVREPHVRLWDESNVGANNWVNNPDLRQQKLRNGDSEGGGHYGLGDTLPNPAGRNLRSVWTIATRPYPGAHFAVFPPELPERCIKAGTSERGICPECGAPWERDQVKGELVSSYVGTDNPDWHEPAPKHVRVADEGESKVDGDFRQRQSVSGWKHLPRRERFTTGWQPTCEHRGEAADDIPEGTEGLQAPPLDGRGGPGNGETNRPDRVLGLRADPAVVLDPFAGSGTVGVVANRLSRRAILIDLNPAYLEQQMRRNAQVPVGL